MGKNQWITLGLGVGLVMVLYFGLDIRPPEAAQKDKERSLQAVQTSADVLIMEKTPGLDPGSRTDIRALNAKLEEATSAEDSSEVYKQLSGKWYAANEWAVAGHYAEQVAEIEKTAESWSIAGTTFASALNQEELPEKEREFIVSHARQAFENAISLEPSNVNHRLNLAVTFVEAPPEDNPMKGIQMLLKLSEEHPDNAAVLFQLGRFGIQTGQYEKAIERLEKVVSLEPNRTKAYCLLSKAYLETGETQKAGEAQEKCTKQN